MASLVDITNNFNNSQIGVCKRTIQRCLHRCDFRKRGIRKKMGVRAVNRVRRVSWARTKLGWTVHENWRNIIFSDEMSIIVSGNELIKVWRKRTEGFLPECIGYLKQHEDRNLKVMVWGCITYFGQGTLTFVHGKYIKLLDDNLWPVVAKYFLDKPYMFQDDNAPPHSSRQTKLWKETNEIPMISWPAQSPDLNIIANVWLLMKNTVKKNMRDINTVHDLKRVLLRTWKSIPLMYIQNLYSSISKRLRVGIRSKCHITKY